MKQFLLLLLAFGVMVGCADQEEGSEERKKQKEKEVKAEAVGTVYEDGFIKYRGAEWKGDHDELTVKVNSVSVKNDVGLMSSTGETYYKNMVSIWLEFENNGEVEFLENFIYAKLVTSTGEQVTVLRDIMDPEMGKPLYGGAKRSGDVYFFLEETDDVENIDWVRLVFSTERESVWDTKDHNIKLQLK